MEDAVVRQPLLNHTSPPHRKVRLYETLRHYCRKIFTWHVLKTLLLGQVLSLFICGTAVTSQLLAEKYRVDAPMLQSFISYCLLCLVYTVWLACRSGQNGLLHIMKERWWKYLLLSLVDVEASYVVVKAYQFTTLTSVQLLYCVSIPVLMVLSWYFLHSRYKVIHYIAVVVCLLGVGIMVGADVLSGRDNGTASNMLIGDALVILGACLYAVSNVYEEYIVKNLTREELLGMLGLFGVFISGIQLIAVEYRDVAAIEWDWSVGLLFAAFALCMFVLYFLMSLVMKITSATSMNLGILTADIYSLFFGVFLFGYKFSAIYILAFAMIMVGFIMYCSTATYSVEPSSQQSNGGIENSMMIEETPNKYPTPLQ